MKQLFVRIVLTLLVLPLFFTCAQAQDSQNKRYTPRQSQALRPNAHNGDSPTDPPKSSDHVFVVDNPSLYGNSGGLDTGCSFQSDAPNGLIINIPINHVVGDVAKLRAAGLISPYATLVMPAYDVDNEATTDGSYQPEIDKVYINGVDQGNLLGTLHGVDDDWQINTFQIPIDKLKFPAYDPANPLRTQSEVTNTITIIIDTGNPGKNYWCTSIDWAALEFKVARPVVFAHGILSDHNAWDFWADQIRALGLPYDQTIDLGMLNSIQQDAATLAQHITSDKANWNADSVTLVAHSKGGLDSREYAEKHDDVAKLLQIDSPNGGSGLADIGVAAQVFLYSWMNANKIPTSPIAPLFGPAGVQLTPLYMGYYNSHHGHNINTQYTSMAGDYTIGCTVSNPWTCLWGVPSLLLTLTENPLLLLKNKLEPSDTIVSVDSALALGYASHVTYASSGSDDSAVHTNINKSLGAYSLLKGVVGDYSSESFEQAVSNARRYAQLNAKQLKASELSPSGAEMFTPATVKGNLIKQSETQSANFVVDSTTQLTTLLLYPSGQLDLSLTSPSGKIYNANSPDANYSSSVQLLSKATAMEIDNPEVGTWTATVTGSSVTDASGSAIYSFHSFLNNPSTQLIGGFGKANIHTGDELQLTASLTNNGVAVTGATANAIVLLPDGTTTTIALHDDGANGDAVKNDGVYSANFMQTTQVGNYSVLLQASSSSPAFERQSLMLATASSSASTLNGSFSDDGVDSDSDGFFNQLKLTAGVSITKDANYQLLATLTDSKGDSWNASFSGILTTADKSVTFYFDGALLYTSGVDGPYTLSAITMAEESDPAIMPLDSKGNAYQTKAYKATDFQHEAISASGPGSSQGIDTDSDGLFDQLVVNFAIDVTQAGSYDWTGSLVDKNGTLITSAGSSGTLSAGGNTVKLTFSGSAIGAHGVNGPYKLNDVLIYGMSQSASYVNLLATDPYKASQFVGFTGTKLISTTTTLASTSAASGSLPYGLPVTFTAVVTPTSGFGSPTGNVIFTLDGTDQPVTPINNGSVTFSITPSVGAHTVTARYVGDADYASSVSSASSVNVYKASTTITLTVSPTTFNYLESPTLTAVVAATPSGGIITNNVVFTQTNSDGTTVQLGSVVLSKGASGAYTAVLTGKSFSIGSYTITVSYAGDSNNDGSSSSPVKIVVTDKPDLTLGNISSQLTLDKGSSASFTAGIITANGFADPVTIGCTGLPANLICALSATGVTTGSTITLQPTGGSYPSSLVVTVSSTSSATNRSLLHRKMPWSLALAMMLGAVLLPARQRSRLRASVLFSLLLLALFTASCGGPSKHVPVTSTATLNIASAGAHPISHSYTFTVTVQ